MKVYSVQIEPDTDESDVFLTWEAANEWATAWCRENSPERIGSPQDGEDFFITERKVRE